MALLVIRILPEKPMSPADFTAALNGLTITARDLSFGNTDAGILLGTAKYFPPDALIPPDANDAATIVQHFDYFPTPTPTRNDFSVATAAIKLLGGIEYKEKDIVLEISRGGGTIPHKKRYFNVPFAPGGLPVDHNDLKVMTSVSLHLFIPPSSKQLGGGPDQISLSEDGTPPNYQLLKAAVETVLAQDPTGLVNLKDLTLAQCKHIAYELAWNKRSLYPLPVPPSGRTLEVLYTTPNNNDEESDRRIFEGDLQGYYAITNAEAEQLTNYIYALAAAHWAEEQSTQTKQVFYRFPVNPTSASTPDGKIGLTQLILEGAGGGPMSPSFSVGANFFYALGADMPIQIDAAQRYQIAIREKESGLKEKINKAIEQKVIDDPSGVPMTQWQAVRRLLCLYVFNASTLTVQIVTDPGHISLLNNWLGETGEDISTFWLNLGGPNEQAHRDLMLRALSRNHSPLFTAVPAAGGTTAAIIAGWTEAEWRAVVDPAAGGDINNIPNFILPGSDAERVSAFLRYIKKFFDPQGSPLSAPGAALATIPSFEMPEHPLGQLLATGFDFTTWDGTQASIQGALDDYFPGDPTAQAAFTTWLNCIKGLLALTAGIEVVASPEKRFAVMEALWARGITNKEIVNQYSFEDLVKALSGSVAYDHAWTVWEQAGSVTPNPIPGPSGFVPVNPDGSLTNCIPPAHRSPLGPVAYLHDLLGVSETSTCATPIDSNATETLETLLDMRRGPLGLLHASDANLNTPIPLIDIVNESLEFMVATDTDHGTIYNTAIDQIGGHELTTIVSPTLGTRLHDPETLLEALPEHSTSATPVEQPDAYTKLKNDFSSPNLPYNQALDINCTYLKALKTCRYEVLRRFRKDITEFVLDPALETAEFQKHLWRYPLRPDVAKGYFCMSDEEYRFFTGRDVQIGSPQRPAKRRSRAVEKSNEKPLHELFGFLEAVEGQFNWTEIVVQVPEFLDRNGLDYCEFIELWKSGFVKFFNKPEGNNRDFPECEPCCLDGLVIQFEEPEKPEEALYQLSIFIRLWKKIKMATTTSCGCKKGYSFTELRDICDVLQLFNGAIVNPDFIHQLVHFQIFVDEFDLSLTDGSKPAAGAVGADRMHILAFWENGAAKFEWAKQHLLDQIQQYAQKMHGCGCRAPEFIKLLKDNLNALTLLAGFESDAVAGNHHWHEHPTKTLRFAEILAKIYASNFTVGELLFLFTADSMLQGDEPFPLQTPNEANDSPFGLPDDEDEFALWALRKKLLAVLVETAVATDNSWSHIEDKIISSFGLDSTSAGVLLSLGQHFFPTTLVESGISVPLGQQRYSVLLAAGQTSAAMWNTPADGPFQYEAGQLHAKIPLTDEAVLAKLARIRQLNNDEQQAVRDLYLLPRKELAHFALLFPNFSEAEEKLIQEPDEARRWAWFQQQFALCEARHQVVAEHLAAHVAHVTNQPNQEATELAKLIVKSLWADENVATSTWENDNGQAPNVTWPLKPVGGAYTALFGLVGTGMPLSYKNSANTLVWKDVRGGAEVFGPEENDWNAPLPTIIPAMNLNLTPASLSKFITLHNGFALANPNDKKVGGAEAFKIEWDGLMLIEQDGNYAFMAGTPTPDGELPNFKQAAHDHQWRVVLKRGQKNWVLLSHEWPAEESPADCSKAVHLRKGMYNLTIELIRNPLFFNDVEDVCPQTTGFQLKYNGPDSGQIPIAIPFDKLFQQQKNPVEKTLTAGTVPGLLDIRYTASVRDMRRSYQRAFKALLFAYRLGLSAQKISDDGQSELGFMLANPGNFAGQSYYKSGTNYITHKADFDFNFLPILDNYHTSNLVGDERSNPSDKRKQAMFDWWERLFDYSVMRRESAIAPERPAWLLFHESKEVHPDDVSHLLRHLGISVNHSGIVQLFNPDYALNETSHTDDLDDDRWAVRAWKAELWLRDLERNFYAKDIRTARPDLWASIDPNAIESFATESGNANLTKFYRDGCIENQSVLRYENFQQLNDCLRLRGRNALVEYLTQLNRVTLPWGGSAQHAKHLSELLLIDVETGLCQKASRIEEAVSAVQLFVQRARLGLEPNFTITADFILAWDRHFATFHNWEACKRRNIYRENWIEWDELQTAQRSETYQFLETKLREATLTVPVPGGLVHWNGKQTPKYPATTLLQHRQPSYLNLLKPDRDGLGLMGTPDRHAQPSWLSPFQTVMVKSPQDFPNNNDVFTKSEILADGAFASNISDNFPLWLQAAVRLGTKFVRVAAAGIPPASTTLMPKCSKKHSPICCTECGKIHPALMDEYYFWIEPSEQFKSQEQNADWGKTEEFGVSDWHRDNKLPRLLQWPSEPMIHLRWCRVHNGEFQEPRQSYQGLGVSDIETADLIFLGRVGDSLNFSVTGGLKPIPEAGYPNTPLPGFRYDMVPDEAIILPEVVASTAPALVGGLTAYPYFAYFSPGAPLLPPSMFSPALTMAGHLRAHCQYEAALKWYELYYNPLLNDNTWANCQQDLKDGITNHNRIYDCCCASDPVTDLEAKQRAFLLHYVETLLQWGDALMRKNTPGAFQKARLIFDTAAKILGNAPTTVLAQDNTNLSIQTISQFIPDCAPLNDRLRCLYDTVTDRIELIHHCLNAKRLKNGRPNLDMPYFGDSRLRDCWKTNDEVCADENEWCLPQSPYRFMVLIQKAQEIAGEVRSLGSALLAAYEKGDGEYLSYMRTTHERQLLELTKDIRKLQWRESDWQVQALYKTKEMALTRLQFYKDLIANGLKSGEIQYVSDMLISQSLRDGAKVAETAAGIMQVIPDIYAGFPISLTHLPVGTKLAEAIFQTVGRILNGIAERHTTNGNLELTKAGWERREDEWKHQVEVITIEIQQIERQILASERRRDIALMELNNHQQQIDNSAEVQDFLRDKFTNHSLYLWMQQETAALHYKMYEIALHCSRQAQRAFNFERGHMSRQFIPSEIWDNLHEGLLAGERLSLSLKQMDKAYYDENVREYELTKHISLRLVQPAQLLQLRETGYCEIELPEWRFDLDHPGHYLRRIKNVSLTFPCVVGLYTSVNCRLTLLSSTTRVSPLLAPPVHDCCKADGCGCSYQTLPDDARIVNMYAATEAIATSSGQNDSGMFELNFRDERYLPFEYAGAVSRWRIELPKENNFFDLNTLTDVVMHLNYTAREGGNLLRKAANDCAQRYFAENSVQLWDLKMEMPDAWYQFQSCDNAYKEFDLRLNRAMFPYLPGKSEVWSDGFEIFFETNEYFAADGMVIQFKVDSAFGHLIPDECDGDMIEIHCVKSAECPILYHGSVQMRLGPITTGGKQGFGRLKFPESIREVQNIWLLNRSFYEKNNCNPNCICC